MRQVGVGPVSDQPFLPLKAANPSSGALVSAAKANVVLDVRLVNGSATFCSKATHGRYAQVQTDTVKDLRPIGVAPGHGP